MTGLSQPGDAFVQALKDEMRERYFDRAPVPDIVAGDSTFWYIVLEIVDTVAERHGYRFQTKG